MQLRDPVLLREYMKLRDFSGARLARYAGCSRQFIWQLINDPTKNSCTREIGRRIEEGLSVLPGTLFMDSMSPGARQPVKSHTSRQKAA